METSTAVLFYDGLSTSQYLVVAFLLVLMISIIVSQLATHKQIRYQRDTSLDQHIVNVYKKKFYAMVHYPFRHYTFSQGRKKQL
jgi:hypothetical protein